MHLVRETLFQFTFTLAANIKVLHTKTFEKVGLAGRESESIEDKVSI